MKLIRKKQLYYASLLSDLDRDIILPKVPDNFLTRGRFAEYKTKRNCLYTTIDDALSSFLGQDLEGSVVYIYEPVGIIPDNLIEANITEIPYSIVLPEFWYCNSMRVKLTHIIKVGKKKETIEYHYGKRQTVAKIYKWHWKEKLDKYGKPMVIKRFSERPEKEKKSKVSNKALGLAISGTATRAAIHKKEKRYSLFGDLVRGAIKGMASEINKDSGGNWNNTNDIIFGTLVLSRFIDASRYLGKNYTYTVKPTLEVSAKENGSIISWDVNENFEKFDSCPDNWSSFTIEGKAKKGEYLTARIITKQGKLLTGKVLVEVR